MNRALALALATTLALSAAPAAAQVGGATYTGTHGGGRGGSASLTLNAAGTRVIAYSFGEVVGDHCSFVANGKAGVWEGAALSSSGAFSYRLFDAIVLDGDFAGRTATGTLRLRNRRPCDSGLVRWSVAAPGQDPPEVPGVPTPPPSDRVDPDPPQAPSSTPPPRSGGSTTTPPATKQAARRTVRGSIAVNRRGARIIGRLRAAQAVCVTRRKLTLKHGKRVVARGRTTSNGTFVFKRGAKTRNRTLRVSAATLRKGSITCAAATSARVRG